MRAALLGLLLASGARLAAADAASPIGEPALDPATTTCLGASWIIGGDDDADARVAVAWRAKGAQDWHAGMDLWRVEKGAQRQDQGPFIAVPDGAWLFAGSVLWLEPGTDYELRLTLEDPDGGTVERVLAARTAVEPIAAADSPVRHVAPGDGGGSGTQADPFRGFASAQKGAKPGDILVVHAGVYPPAEITVSGEPGKPIVWRGEPGAVIDGGGDAARGISAGGVHDVWFEGLEIRRVEYGLVGHGSARVVIRGCRFHDLHYGITATRDGDQPQTGWFIADNVIEGPSTWPRSKGIEGARGIQLNGEGHEICHNRVHGFADAIDTFQDGRCAAIDIHHNDCSLLTDDGAEMDYTQRNVRLFRNRFTNAYQGISLQPVHGGPAYVLRNVLVNVCVETFKLHNRPSGVFIAHNTIYRRGSPLSVMTPEELHRIVTRDNLLIGLGEAKYAVGIDPAAIGCDFDHDGFGGGPWAKFSKWNGQRSDALASPRGDGQPEPHAVAIDPATCFATPPAPLDDEKVERPVGDDLRLAEGSAAVDAGVPLPGINDGFAGKAPDLGAYELGDELPTYGPRDPAKAGRKTAKR